MTGGYNAFASMVLSPPVDYTKFELPETEGEIVESPSFSVDEERDRKNREVIGSIVKYGLVSDPAVHGSTHLCSSDEPRHPVKGKLRINFLWDSVEREEGNHVGKLDGLTYFEVGINRVLYNRSCGAIPVVSERFVEGGEIFFGDLDVNDVTLRSHHSALFVLKPENFQDFWGGIEKVTTEGSLLFDVTLSDVSHVFVPKNLQKIVGPLLEDKGPEVIYVGSIRKEVERRFVTIPDYETALTKLAYSYFESVFKRGENCPLPLGLHAVRLFDQ